MSTRASDRRVDALKRWLRWLVEPESLPRQAPRGADAGRPPTPSRSSAAWLFSAEPFPTAETPVDGEERETRGAFRWLLGPEPFPTAETPVDGEERKTHGALRWLLGPEPFPTAGISAPLGDVKRRGLFHWLFALEPSPEQRPEAPHLGRERSDGSD